MNHALEELIKRVSAACRRVVDDGMRVRIDYKSAKEWLHLIELAKVNASAPAQHVSVPDDAGKDVRDKAVRQALVAAHSAIVYKGESTTFDYALQQLTIALSLTAPKDTCNE